MFPILRFFHHRMGNEARRRALLLKTTDFDTIESMLQDPDPYAAPLCLPIDFLKAITLDFSREQELGRGGHGVVYKGVLQNGKAIAVKKLSEMHLEDAQFHNEVTYLIGLKHQNIVQLVGYCAESRWEATQVRGKYVMAEIRKRLLCFEYVNNKSLEKYISAESCGLEWHWRYDMIRGICSGLHYLHTECRIVHLDLKPENILLDDNMVPKITDFGISRLFGQQQSRVITESREGTLGYMAPEYLRNGLISNKSDIFSFGVIVIELITGSRDYPQSGAFGQYMENVAANWRNRLEKVHRYMPLEIYSQQVNTCIMIGLKCVDPDPEKRPAALDIIQMLDKIESTDRLTSELQTSLTSNRCTATSSNQQKSFGPIIDKVSTSKTANTSSAFTFSGKGTKAPILAFQIANTVVKGSCLMNTVSKQNIQHLKEGVLRSKGVRLLISEDYSQLLHLVQADIRDELRQFVKDLARLGNQCSDPIWHNLERYYSCRLRSGVIPPENLREAAIRGIQQLMISAHFTSELYSEFLASDMLYITLKDQTLSKSIRSQVKNQRNVVKKLKKKSFWSKTIEEVLERLDEIFMFMLFEVNTNFSNYGDQSVTPMSNLHQTLGPAGLALHYANVILQINNLYFHALASPAEVLPREARDALFQALPRSIRSKQRQRSPKEKVTMISEVRADMDRTLGWLVTIAESTKQYYENGAFGEWAMKGIEDVDNVHRSGADQHKIISPMLTLEISKVNKIETLFYASKERTESYILDLVRGLQYLAC